MADGLISIKERIKKGLEETSTRTSKMPRQGTYSYSIRGQSSKPQEVSFFARSLDRSYIRSYITLLLLIPFVTFNNQKSNMTVLYFQ